MTTTSEHVYSARLPDPGGDVALSWSEGSPGEIVLDASAIPYVAGTITLAVEDAMLLEELDPRDSRRVVVDVNSITSGTSQSRSFDLGIRRGRPDRAAGTVTLTLSSDEAIVMDYAQLIDDNAPRALEQSLREVCEYVLSKVPGVARNLEPNSRALASGSTAPYGARNSWTRTFGTTTSPPAGFPYSSIVRFTAPADGTFYPGIDSFGYLTSAAPGTQAEWIAGPRVTPGQVITVSRWVRVGGQSIPFRVLVRFHDGAGNWLSGNLTGEAAPAGSAGWSRPSWTGVVPAGAKYFSVRTQSVSTQTVTAGTFMDTTGGMTEVTGRVRSWRDQVLETGTTDADVTAYWPVANLVSNPSFETNVTGWAAGTNASAPARFSDTAQGEVSGAWVARWAASAAGSSYIDYQDISISPGSSYVLSAHMYSEDAARNGRVMMRFKAGNGTILRDVYGPTTALLSSAWSRLSVIAVAPPGAEKATLHLEHIATAGGQAARADGVMFHEGTEVIPYFDGSTVDSTIYTYDWTDATHASNSTRTPIVERPPESLVWRAGESGMSFLEPLLKASGLRLVCDEQRRWSLRSAEYRADGEQTYRHAVNIQTADEELSREEDDWFDGAVYEYIWTDRNGVEQHRTDAYALPGASKVIRREVRNTPYPGPGRARFMVQRAQGRGRAVTVSAIPSWLEQTDQPLNIMLEGTPIQTGIAGSIRFDFGSDTVTVTSRTTDTPAGAIDLLSGTINALAGSINAQ